MLTEPVVLIEIVSPSNEADTRRNVWAYTSIPSAAEILLLSSTSMSGELLRRNPQGEWAGDPFMLGADSMAELASADRLERCSPPEHFEVLGKAAGEHQHTKVG